MVKRKKLPAFQGPTPPALIQGVALEEWQRITAELHTLGLIAEINRSMIAAFN